MLYRFCAVLALAGALAFAAPAEDPYPAPSRAASDLQQARKRAAKSHKVLMVIFGGNWCPDCRVLHQRLAESPVKEYVAERFEIVGINIGDQDKQANTDIAKALGVTLDKGVPAAAFVGPDGKSIGATNQGELEPARRYDAQQVLAFLRGVAEQHVIAKPEKR